jgi:hypothetical protein
MQLAVNIVALAAIYALIATGYVFAYRANRVFSLTHGELMMLGSYLLVAGASGIPPLRSLQQRSRKNRERAAKFSGFWQSWTREVRPQDPRRLKGGGDSASVGMAGINGDVRR